MAKGDLSSSWLSAVCDDDRQSLVSCWSVDCDYFQINHIPNNSTMLPRRINWPRVRFVIRFQSQFVGLRSRVACSWSGRQSIIPWAQFQIEKLFPHHLIHLLRFRSFFFCALAFVEWTVLGSCGHESLRSYIRLISQRPLIDQSRPEVSIS